MSEDTVPAEVEASVVPPAISLEADAEVVVEAVEKLVEDVVVEIEDAIKEI